MDKLLDMSPEKLSMYILLTIIIWMFREVRGNYLEKEKTFMIKIDEALKKLVALKITLLSYAQDINEKIKLNVMVSLGEASPYLNYTFVEDILREIGNESRDIKKLELIIQSLELEIKYYYSEKESRMPQIKEPGFLDMFDNFNTVWLKPILFPVFITAIIISVIYLGLLFVTQLANLEKFYEIFFFILGSLGIFLAFLMWLGLIDTIIKQRKKQFSGYIIVFVYSLISYLILKYIDKPFDGVILLPYAICFLKLYQLAKKKNYL